MQKSFVGQSKCHLQTVRKLQIHIQIDFFQFLSQNRASKRLHQTVLIVEIGSQNFRAVPAIVKPDQNHPKAIKKPQTVPIPIEINCYNCVLAMLHNSNRIDPMAEKNQVQVELMCLDLGLQGNYSIPRNLRKIDFYKKWLDATITFCQCYITRTGLLRWQKKIRSK